jgi:hypothetical protein
MSGAFWEVWGKGRGVCGCLLSPPCGFGPVFSCVSGAVLHATCGGVPVACSGFLSFPLRVKSKLCVFEKSAAVWHVFKYCMQTCASIAYHHTYRISFWVAVGSSIGK